jgi:Fur family ferric uptake transcriptional regulator
MKLQTGRGNLRKPLAVARVGAATASETVIGRDQLDIEALKRILRTMNLKVTDQRLAILAALTRGRIHATSQEVYERVKKTQPEIGFATVYRLLKYLALQGYVTEVRMGGLPARYELTPRAHHDHLACTQCGRIVEFANADIEELQRLVARNNGFQLTGHVLELYGLCPSCQELNQQTVNS